MHRMIVIIGLVLSVPLNAFAWNDTTTHPTISEYAAEMVFQRVFDSAFMDKTVKGKRVRLWVREGAEREDDWLWYRLSESRSRNHFHAPNRPLDTAGWKEISGMSTPLWAQDGTEQGKFVGGDWSWGKVRLLYYTHLTAADIAVREGLASAYLEGLGYQMHLVQDMSQPNHVRDDTHIADGFGWKLIVNGLETWAKDKDLEIIRKKILANPDLYPVPNIQVDLKQLFNNDTSVVPVARLYDTRTYAGSSTPSTSLTQGLAEYTNANFFSESTSFAAERYSPTDTRNYFPYPRKDETNLQQFIDTYLDPVVRTDVDGKSYATFEIAKHNTRGESLDCLAMPGPNTLQFFQEYGGESAMFYNSFRVDEHCMEEYAGKLIPRAVGYSAALLDYFFRGKLEASLSTLHPSTSKTMNLMVKNSTPGEEMTGGKLVLVLRYRQFAETTTSLVAPTPDAEYSYTVVELPSQTVPSATPGEYSFPLPQPLPLWTKDLAVQVVYQGTLGNEAGAVAVSPWIGLQRQPLEIELKLPASGVYAATTDSSPFTEIHVNARNNLPDGQAMTDGAISLYLLYRTSKTNPFLSQEVTSLPSTGYSLIKVTENNMRSLPAGSPVEFSFDLSAMPLPLWVTDLYLYVVYQGTVSDGVTTRPNVTVAGMLDVSEPTPVDVFNNADKICINKQWYSAGSTEAIALSDNNNLFDPYPHTITNIFARASSTAVSTPASSDDFTFSSPPSLAGGEFRRLGYILTDYSFRYSVLEDWVNVEPTDPWTIIEGADQYPGTGVKNQTDVDGTYTWPDMYTIRGKQMWWGAGVIYDNDAYSANPGCDWSSLQEGNAGQ